MAKVRKCDLLDPKPALSSLKKEGEALEEQLQFIELLRWELHSRGIDCAIVEEGGWIYVFVDSIDATYVKGVIGHLEMKAGKA